MKKLILFSLSIVCFMLTTAQERAITQSGKNVVLFDNGTWQLEIAAPQTRIVKDTILRKTENTELFYSVSSKLSRFFGDEKGRIKCNFICSSQNRITSYNVCYTKLLRNQEMMALQDCVLFGVNGKAIKPRSENQTKMVKAIDKNDMLFAIGPAGSGKTYMAIAIAVSALKSKQVRRIILSRPAVEAGEKLGFLPGDMKEKIDPYLQPLYDALQDMIPSAKLKEYMENGTIQIAPLAFMRGRTLNDAVVILDEAQNTTSNQLKMFLTRMGAQAKFIITRITSYNVCYTKLLREDGWAKGYGEHYVPVKFKSDTAQKNTFHVIRIEDIDTSQEDSYNFV